MIPLAPRFGTLVLLVENSEDGSHAQSQIGVATTRVVSTWCRSMASLYALASGQAKKG